MVVFIFVTLILWLALSVHSLSSTVRIFQNSLKTKKPRSPTGPVIDSEKIISKNPELVTIIKSIINLEKYPNDEACITRASLLKTKLKVVVRNPVIRRALIDAIKSRKK